MDDNSVCEAKMNAAFAGIAQRTLSYGINPPLTGNTFKEVQTPRITDTSFQQGVLRITIDRAHTYTVDTRGLPCEVSAVVSQVTEYVIMRTCFLLLVDPARLAEEVALATVQTKNKIDLLVRKSALIAANA